MTPRGAARFAMIGMILLTVLLLAGLIRDVSSVLDGLVPAARLLVSVIEVVASLGVTLFFYVFQRTP